MAEKKDRDHGFDEKITFIEKFYEERGLLE